MHRTCVAETTTEDVAGLLHSAPGEIRTPNLLSRSLVAVVSRGAFAPMANGNRGTKRTLV